MAVYNRTDWQTFLQSKKNSSGTLFATQYTDNANYKYYSTDNTKD